MQVVIEIPDEVYNDIMYAKDRSRSNLNYYEDIISKGIQLSKGHRKLIILSEDAVKREQVPLSFSCQNWISEAGLSRATVAIIEADKTESGE